MNYQQFDIVMLRPEFASRIFGIVEIIPGRPLKPYVGVKLDRGPLGKRYLLDDDGILAKIGNLDPAALKLDPAQVEQAPSLDWETGKYFAMHMAERAASELDRRRWRLLASLKPGDPVALLRDTSQGKRIEQHRFRNVLPNGQKYHFAVVNRNGVAYRWTLEALYLGSEASETT
jgi:hypothetical protein